MHKLVSNKLFNFLFIGTIIMVVFGFQNGHFFIAKAFNNKVNILPGNFSLVQNEGSEMRWQEASNAFIQDLFNDNEFQDFNKQNSTYIVQGEIAEDDIEEIDSLDDSEEKSSSDAVEASEDKETPISSGSSSGGGGSSSQNNSTETQEENKINESDEGDEKANAESLDDIENAGNEEVDEETSVKGIEYPSAMEIDNENNSDSSQESVESKSSEGDDSSEVIDEQEESASSPVEDTLKEPEISSPEPSIPENNSSNSSPTSESQEVSILDGFKSFLSFFNIDSLFSLEEANAENDILSQELIFSDFFVPISVDENNLSNLALNLSFASHSEYNRDSLRIEYKIDEDWNELDELFLEHEISNKDNFGYFSYAFPNSISLDELANLQIRLTYLNPDYLEEGGIELYLDAIWLELEYNSKFEINGDVELQDDEFMDVVFEEAEGETAVVEKNFDLEQLSEKFDFQSRETPKFNFKFSKRKKMLSKIVSAITGIFSDEYDDISIKARVLSSGDDELPVDINIKYIKDGEFELELGELPRHFKPGKQSIEIIIEKNGEIFIDQKDFTWGVFAINFDKSIYLENELAYIQMAVLTDTGDTVCDAKLKIEVESPDGRAQILSTEEGTIYYSGKCGPNNVIDIPDYYAYYNVDEAGIYDVKLTIITDSEERVISDSFKVQESVLFEVERIGPTRIYPWEDYEMKFRILANADYKGTFTEFLPTNFKIVEKKQDGKLLNTEEVVDNIDAIEKELVWQIDWKAGHEYILTYTVDFPNISPEFYLLGPAKAEGLVYWEDGEKNKIEPDAIDFVEARQWQIASDDQTSYGTAGAYDFVVPAGVSSITAKIWGAGGGAGGCDDDTVAGGDGGGGGFVTGTIAVTPLETLRVIVGAGGVGGGVGGNNVSGDGGGGGGESALRRGVATYLFVAGSGGGGGGGDDNAGMADGGAGGAGGGNTGVDGADAGSGSAAPGGAGGSQIIGGAGGNSANDYDGTDGGYLSGGNGGGEPVAGGGAGGAPGGGAGGANSNDSDDMGGGGGGGSGYYGGGGGADTNDTVDGAAGGGGGSSWAIATAASVSTNAGSGRIAGNTGDSDYASSAGLGALGPTVDETTGPTGNPGRVVLNYIPLSDVTVSATGTQASKVDMPSTNNYLGGAFVLVENTGTSSVTDITITESGTVDAQDDLSNIKLYYDLDSSAPYDCGSENYADGATQFGTTQSSFDATNGISTFSVGTGIEISTTSSMCLYVVLDADTSGSKNETIEIEIDNPENEVVLESGSVKPSTSVEISGSTLLYTPDVITTADEQRKSDNFTNVVNQGWTNENQIILSALAQESEATTTKFDYYFKLVDEDGTFETATSAPSSSCVSGTAFGSCSSKIWTASASTTTWYDQDWEFRKKIIINSNMVETSESAFVVLATTTDIGLADTANGGNMASSTGGDILLIDEDGMTILDYEREYYNNTTGELVIWVETSISSTTNKTIYLYYGNSVVTADQQDIAGTWDSGYTMVNHLKDDPNAGGVVSDSTSNSNDAGASAGMTSADLISGKIGQSIDFDGDADTLSVSDSNSMDEATGPGQARTYSYWLNFTTVTENTLISDKANPGFSGLSFWSEVHANPNKIRGGVETNNQLVSDTTFSTGEWYYVIFEHDGTNTRLYVNGELDDGPNIQTGVADNDRAMNVMGIGNNYEVNGILDELRVTNVSHSAAWIKTEYNNQNSVDSFLSIGSEENIGGASYEAVVNITSIPDRGSSTDSTLGYKWQAIACNDSDNCSFWNDFNGSIPNFKIDTDTPSSPGNLTLSTTTATSITLDFGSQVTEDNFAFYKIFYKDGISGVDTNDSEHADSNLNSIDYSDVASTTIHNLEPETQYVINIWAYDLAGNKTSASEIKVTTQTAAHARARSVMFFAGNYSGNGTSGKLTDTNQTFSSFNFNLAETGVDIKNAYILFEAQFEAYHSNSSEYTGYNLSFDVCQESCSANAFTGSGRILKDDNTSLVYSETGSNQVRLLMDVTEEFELANYLGDGGNMEAQVGYNIETGSATSSIASAKATLIITYAYDDDNSTNFTNTVIYPLESTGGGDSGTRINSQVDDCAKDSDCPLFNYNMEIPEISTKLSQWYQIYLLNDGNGTNDVKANINIEGINIDSNTFIHEARNGGDQGGVTQIVFNGVSGFSENTSQTLEYYTGSDGAPTYYLQGGEVVETYTAAKSASVKTRTVSFPIGIITNGQSTVSASGTTDVYFPENGSGSGIVDVKKAWFRIISNSYNTGAYTLTVSSKVGDSSESGNYAYNFNAGDSVVKPSFNIIHVIPLSSYSELELANASTPKTLVLNTTNSNVNMGGVSAELMITYTYTDESSGYLSSLNLFGGQTDVSGNTTTTVEAIAKSVFPELKGTETVRVAALLGSSLFSDNDGAMPSAWFSSDVNIAVSNPICSNSYDHHDDGVNSFGEFYRIVTQAMNTADDQLYSACYSNTNSTDTSAGAKMNATWLYTYTWDAPPTNLTQIAWRWYENLDSSEPTTAKASENNSINGVNVGEVLRLRMNVGVTKTDLATSTQSFKLQFAEGVDCPSIATSTWADVGGIAGSEAWLGYNNPAPADNTTLTSTLLASSTEVESYEESNPTASNPRGIPAGKYGEWDWVIYNNSAISSAGYCFRMIKNDNSLLTDYLDTSYPKLTTAPSNTAPNTPTSLRQYRSNGPTFIPNATWINENDLLFTAAATDPNTSEVIGLYFQLIPISSGFITATTVPASPCLYGTAYESCGSKVWLATSTISDYRTNAYVATTSITAVTASNINYKWQVLSCDDDGACSSWVKPGSSPNFRIDMIPPTPPGALSFSDVNATDLTITYGASTTENNFVEYKIFYKVGSIDVTEGDEEFVDGNLDYKNYNDATSTVADSLAANTQYVFNIWAYDVAGNKASSSLEVATTTKASFNPPTGSLDNLTAQKIDGSGIVDTVILVDDPDNDDTLRAKVFYEAGDTCAFATKANITIDENDSNTIATYGDPDVDNNQYYQVGTSSSWIFTSPGSNYVFFDWQSKVDIPSADGKYCLGLVVNDGIFDQIATHTKVIVVDNINPTIPGALASSSKDYSSITLGFGTASFDLRFDQYKIFYKEGTSGVTENDNEFNQFDDISLDSANYGTAATTTITGLNPNTTYVFNIWAYDVYGNRASSSVELSVKTNAKPVNISADNQYYYDGMTIISNGSWIDDNDIIFSASVHDQDAGDLMGFYFELITASGTFSNITSVPDVVCASSTPYLSCSDNIWLSTTTASNLPADWYDEDWLYRKKITLDSNYILMTTNDFPVLVDTTDSDLANYARSDAYDILFTDSSGTTTLPYEREYYDFSTGELVAWVKSDVSSTTDTEIYMYYGNIGSTIDNAVADAVWDSGYKGVWHLGENVVDESSQAGIHLDSSANNNDGDQYGNNEMLGMIYQGQDFDGVNDYVEIGDDNSLDMSDAFTLGFWLNGTVTNPPSASTTSFSTAGADTFVVPDGVTEITVKTWGAGGGGAAGIDGGSVQTENPGGKGGGGGFAQATISVTPGETLSIHVGGGGGAGVVGASANGGGGGGGGGRSEIARGATPLVVASGGGGGGGGNDRTYSAGSDGGAGGAEVGIAGDNSGISVGGSGGTQLAGGTAGTGANNGTDGAMQVGGAGADGRNAEGVDGSGATGGVTSGGAGGQGDTVNRYPGGGGGGSGYYGGGGGGENSSNGNAGAGGGGGSSYVESIAIATSTEAGSGTTPANNDDSDYISGTGIGGDGGGVGADGSSGDDGYITISFTPGINIIEKDNAFKIGLSNDASGISGMVNDQGVATTFSSAWHYLTLTYDRNEGGTEELKLFLDGVLKDTTDYSSVMNTNTSPVKIGGLFDGKVDELRISNIARTSEWIKTEYNNQNDVGNFLSISSQSTVTSYYETVFAVNVPDNPDYASGYKWQVKACDDDGDCSPWDIFNIVTPNFKIDTTDPSAPGALVEGPKTSNSITLNFGAQTDEDNFREYKIFYSTISPPTESDNLHASSSDSDLALVDYGSTSNTTVTGLSPDTTYHFNIWAYDILGHKASSSVTSISTGSASSTPGVMFYSKNDSTIYYKIWNGVSWGGEKNSGAITAGGDNIRHIRTVRSDDGGKVGIIFKTSDGVNQEWWGTVYRYLADDFVDSTQLGSSYASTDNNQLITACIASLSGGEYVVARNNNGSTGSLLYSWSATDGWIAESAGPDTGAVLNGCELVRRPGTDNYILMTFDEDSDVGSAYYYGGPTYDDSWTAWAEHSTQEEDTDNYVGQAFFDPSNNTRGAISYSNSNTNFYAYAKYFSCSDSAINFGAIVASPNSGTDDWNSNFVHGEFAFDPTSIGIAYYTGRDTSGNLNTYKVDASNPAITWNVVTSGDNISAGDLYSETNDSQKPFASAFYKGGKGLVIYNQATNPSAPMYSVITTSGNTMTAVASVTGADNNLWSRVKIYNDPYEYESLVILQNDDVDYSAVFWDGGSDQFYDSGSQAWTELVTGAGTMLNDELTSFAFTGFNTPPSSPINLAQYKNDASTVISNQGWTNENTVKFEISATDIDTLESISLYLNLVLDSSSLTSDTSEAGFNACASTTPYDSCNSKIWLIATSTIGDYSATPFTATATISSIASSTVGYKWQAISCDDENECSTWSLFNATQANFYVDDVAPAKPGNLTDIEVDSESVTLEFGLASVEDNFDQYKIFYKIGSAGVSESDNPWLQADDVNLGSKNYGGVASTIVTNLASSTQYVFNIWAYDFAGNTASATIEVSTTTSALPNIVQTSYLLENDDGVDVDSNSAENVADTALSGVYIGERINVRMQIENNGGDIFANKIFKIQFENFSDSPGTWVDMGASTEISYAWGLSGTSGDSITSGEASANLNTWVDGAWYEDTNLTESFSLSNGYYTEFVFAIETSNAQVSDTYHFRLYNETDSKILNGYNNYPTISTVASDNIRFSKDADSSLSATIDNLKYFLDHKGYADLSADDNANRDELISSLEYPYITFVTKHLNNTDAASSTWNGQSSIAPSVNNVELQVYRFGSTNNWISVATNNTTGANTDFDLNATINSNISEYYDGSNWIFWRVYQDSGSQNFKSDYYDANFSAPIPVVAQIHYRWRKDDGSEITANWLEDEDVGNPTDGNAMVIGSSTRLRIAVVNTGGGTASNYTYRLEYASSSLGCTVDPGNWTIVPVNHTTEHFEMVTSTNFNDSDPTTEQTLNSLGYTFVAGDIVEDSSNTSGNITLAESDFTEVEYKIEVTSNANIAETYCFRVTDSGTILNDYDIFPVFTLGGSTNKAPSFSVYPSDNGSAATAPTEYNTNISFNATAGDAEGDDYYLAICQSDAITAGNNASPTCNGGEWCISGATASSTEASCNYNATSSSESLDWYAFVCDKQTGFGVAKCSASSQGIGSAENNSPFVINHPPDFTSVITTVNNIDPGGTTTITAFVTDNDVVNGADTMDLFVCTQNSAVAGVGCAGVGNVELCSELATTTPNAFCKYATSTPAMAGDWTYYAFVFDSHNSAAIDNSRNNTYTINNTVPVLGSLSLNGSSNITLNLKGAADTSISTINTSVLDLNGCNSIVSAVAAIYMTNATNEYNCTVDDNDCYQITLANCIKSECDSQTDIVATFTCTADMKYFASPTDDSTGNPNEPYAWISYMQVYDGTNYSGPATSSQVELITGSGIEILENEIPFGLWSVGDNTGTTNSTSTIVNISNSPIDSNISGTNMTGNPSGTIAVDKIKWSLSGFNYPVSGTPLSGSDIKIEILSPKATTTLNGVEDEIYWGIGIPFSADSSIYTGLNTFSVVLDSDDW